MSGCERPVSHSRQGEAETSARHSNERASERASSRRCCSRARLRAQRLSRRCVVFGGRQDDAGSLNMGSWSTARAPASARPDRSRAQAGDVNTRLVHEQPCPIANSDFWRHCTARRLSTVRRVAAQVDTVLCTDVPPLAVSSHYGPLRAFPPAPCLVLSGVWEPVPEPVPVPVPEPEPTACRQPAPAARTSSGPHHQRPRQSKSTSPSRACRGQPSPLYAAPIAGPELLRVPSVAPAIPSKFSL